MKLPGGVGTETSDGVSPTLSVVGANDFDRDFGRLSGALGDATRRGIYLTVRDSDQPLTAARIARLFSIHPNVARHHLDRLVAEGYLKVSDRPASRPASVGRPPRTFEATDTDVAVSYPARRHDLLAELLVRVVERLSPDEAGRVAEEVGREYGAELADTLGVRSGQRFPEALAAVAQAMTGAGIDVTADAAHQRLLRGHCPFGRTATDHADIVCQLDLGIVRGLMEAAGGDTDELVITSLRHPGQSCLAS
jgi:predicted ArsR family transcriptional regulator